MTGLLGILGAVSAGLGIIGQLIGIAESASQGKAPGKKKKQSVIDSFFGFVNQGVSGGWLRGDWQILAENQEQAKEVVGALVDAAVKVANDVGWRADDPVNPNASATP